MSTSRVCSTIVLAFAFAGQLLGQETSLADRLRAAREIAVNIANAAADEADRFAGDHHLREDSPVLIAQGDSWFAYPFYNVLKFLEWRHEYRIESTAHNGEWLETMAYDTDQMIDLALLFKRIKGQGKTPKAILLSGGGNDIAGPQLTAFLHHRNSGDAPLDGVIVEEMLANRLRGDMEFLITAATKLSQKYFPGRVIPIVIHGYGYPVPDGRGYVGGGMWYWRGPWLRPAFDTKGYQHTVSDLAIATKAMHDLIKRYNEVLGQIPKDPGMEHVRYVNVTDLFSDDLSKYKDDWGNELHPTADGFKRVAERFVAAIENPVP